MNRDRFPPRLKESRLLGSLGAFRRDPLGLFGRALRECGDVAEFRLGPRQTVFVASPAGVERVLVENHRNYTKNTPGQRKLKLFLGEGLLTSQGSFWLRQRRMTQPAFHRERLAGFAAAMSREASAMAASWEARAASGETFDLSAETSRLTMRIVCETLLGFAIDGPESDAVGRALAVLLGEFRRRVANPLLDAFRFVPTRSNRTLAGARGELDRIVHGVIADKRRRGGEGADLLSMLMQARDEDTGEAMDDRQLRDEVMTLFLAGFETTANALNWTFCLLSRHPEIDARLRSETRAVLGARAPALDDLPRLPYGLAVIKEAMRLYPPAWLLARMTEADDELDGLRVAKGTLVLMSPYVTHRHPKFWQDPERFGPDRFLDGRAEALPRYAYFPFGGGPRQCIGNSFALMEAQLALAAVSRVVRLELVDDSAFDPEPTVTLRPRRALMVRAVRT